MTTRIKYIGKLTRLCSFYPLSYGWQYFQSSRHKKPVSSSLYSSRHVLLNDTTRTTTLTVNLAYRVQRSSFHNINFILISNIVGIRVRIGAQCTLFFFILLSGLQVTEWLLQGTHSLTSTACPSQHPTRTTTLTVSVDQSVAAVGGLIIALRLTLTRAGNRCTGIPSSLLRQMYAAHLWW